MSKKHHISQEVKKVDHIGEANEKVKEPEVGDVFESPFVKYMVLISTEVYAHCLVDDNGLEIRNIPTFYLKEKCQYLGKSKVSIKELFDVVVNDTVNDTVKEQK